MKEYQNFMLSKGSQTPKYPLYNPFYEVQEQVKPIYREFHLNHGLPIEISWDYWKESKENFLV